MTLAFDTLKLADRLAAGGFSVEQAKTVAVALSESFTAELPTKADLAEVRHELKVAMADVKAEIADVRTEIANAKTEMVRWLVGAIGFQTIVVIGALVTLLKIFVK